MHVRFAPALGSGFSEADNGALRVRQVIRLSVRRLGLWDGQEVFFDLGIW